MTNNRRLTPDQKETIVELRLRSIPVRTVAEQAGVAVNTVTKVYREYLRARAEEDPAGLELRRRERIAQLDTQADDAARAIVTALRRGQYTAASNLMSERRQAIAQAARLEGTDQPTKIELSGRLEVEDVSSMTNEQLAAAIEELDRQIKGQ